MLRVRTGGSRPACLDLMPTTYTIESDLALGSDKILDDNTTGVLRRFSSSHNTRKLETSGQFRRSNLNTRSRAATAKPETSKGVDCAVVRGGGKHCRGTQTMIR